MISRRSGEHSISRRSEVSVSKEVAAVPHIKEEYKAVFIKEE